MALVAPQLFHTMSQLSKCGWIVQLYAQIKVSGGTIGRQRFRAPMPEATFFLEILVMCVQCIPGKMRVDVNLKKFGGGIED